MVEIALKGINMNLDFKKAIEIAQTNLQYLQPETQDIRLEAAMLNEKGDLYEISFSYLAKGENNLSIASGQKPQDAISLLKSLAMQNRIYKTFFVDAEQGIFRGFKEYQES